MTASGMRQARFIVIGIALLLLFGCVYGRGYTYTEGGTMLGALYGAGIGAAIGSASGHVGEGAGIGALAGSLIGGAIGYGMEGPWHGGRYPYRDRYYDDPYNDPYYNDPYYYDPYYNHPAYHEGPYRRYGGPPPAGPPAYPQGPTYDAQPLEPAPNEEELQTQPDTVTKSNPEDYYQKQNRRYMSPGTEVQ